MRRRSPQPAPPPESHPFPGLDLAWRLLATLPLSAPGAALADAAIPTPATCGAAKVEPGAKVPPKPEGKGDRKVKGEVRVEPARRRPLPLESSTFLGGVIAEVRTPDPPVRLLPKAPTPPLTHDESEDRRYFEAMAKVRECALHPHDPGTPCADLEPAPAPPRK